MRNCRRLLVLIVLLFLRSSVCTFFVQAQDAQYSQFYAAPLLLNPAFAGTASNTRIGANYRNQWPGSGSSFVTNSIYADHFFDRKNSGVALMFTQDRRELGSYSAYRFGAAYSYLVKTGDLFSLRLGLSGHYQSQSIDFSRLVFGDQIDAEGNVSSEPTSENLVSQSIGYPDLDTGFLLYTKNAWFGFSASHLLEPNNSLVSDGTSTLSRKYSIHSGWKWRFPGVKYTKTQTPRRKDRSITPWVQYKMQGEFKQLDIGAILALEPLVFGLSYRGIPSTGGVEGADIAESLITVVGVTLPRFNVGYSFDYTLSKLGISSGGSHEITLSYVLGQYRRPKPPDDVMKLPCPVF